MDKILISYETSIVGELAFAITINDDPVDYTIVGNCVQINVDVQFGLNLLKIRCPVVADQHIALTDFSLNDTSIRQALYLTYHDSVSSTWIVEQYPELTIPFGNPMSWWLTETTKKIYSHLYGTNLYEKYDIYYPVSINVDQHACPKLMKDFMRYNFGFHLVDKQKPIWQNSEIPWVRANLVYDEDLLWNEFEQNQAVLGRTSYTPKQNEHNSRDPVKTVPWQVSLVKRNTPTGMVTEYTREELPEYYKLLDQLESLGIKVLHAFIGAVYPNSYVAPHTDDFYKYNEIYQQALGCTQIYIPIKWKTGNYFKFADVGFMPYDGGAYIVNNADFVHGSLNLSDQVRYTVGMYCELTEDNIKRLTN